VSAREEIKRAMCVIVHKKKDVEIEDAIPAGCFRKNPHGWGIMLARDDEVEVYKGLTWESFLETYEELQGLELVLHFRAKTHGKIDTENCHPHQVSDDLCMMHNGIIEDAPTVKDTMSDSYN